VKARLRTTSRLLRYSVTGAAAAICLGAVVGLGTLARTDVQSVQEDAPPLSVAFERVVLTDGYVVPKTFVGRIEARQQSAMGFEIGGLVASVHVDEGDIVVAGTVIAGLDTARMESRRQELIAARDIAEADRSLAEVTLGRTRESFRLGAASIQDLDVAEQTFAAAAASERRADAAVAAIEVDLSKAVIAAPFDAIIAHRFVDTGGVVAAGEPIVVLLERRGPQVRLGIGGTDVMGITLDEPIGISVGDRSFAGRVLRILPTRNSVSRDVTVIVGLDATLEDVRQGDLARYTMNTPVDVHGFWVPIRALAESDRGLWSMYQIVQDLDEGGTTTGFMLARVEVELLYAEAERAFVRGPFDDDDRFVSDGLHRVTPGMRITPQVETSAGTLSGNR
jgi:RND family efflux transporter MFP subunit